MDTGVGVEGDAGGADLGLVCVAWPRPSTAMTRCRRPAESAYHPCRIAVVRGFGLVGGWGRGRGVVGHRVASVGVVAVAGRAAGMPEVDGCECR